MKVLSRDVAEDFDAKLYLFVPILSTSPSLSFALEPKGSFREGTLIVYIGELLLLVNLSTYLCMCL